MCAIVRRQKCLENSHDPSTDVTPAPPCTASQTCVSPSKRCDPHSKKCVPRKPYLEWHGNKCVRGNYMLKKWCTEPQSRGDAEHGFTDVPPFRYDASRGECTLTPEYCKWMGVSWRPPAIPEQGGSCHRTPGQVVGEFFIGKTLFRGLKKADRHREWIPVHLPGSSPSSVTTYYHPGHKTLGFDWENVRLLHPEVARLFPARLQFSSRDLQRSAEKRKIYFILSHSDMIHEAAMSHGTRTT